ncbi:uncharacterized protein LOC119403609 [Rhipicephalus sanguineus]|uniref:uncharacterized protein LOC119403609 n=1 Tax=Rhipicephalus sanguineus TaxID=34632 RepID=UPI0020C49C6E|nr:uncharacterized protein LOC119403609 [Rhipicephalus sanguineus]
MGGSRWRNTAPQLTWTAEGPDWRGVSSAMVAIVVTNRGGVSGSEGPGWCHKALAYARDNFSHDRIVYDTLDVEHHDPESLTERYGAFDRVYSFLAFHYVADIAKAYRNIFKLLKGGGECLVLSIVKADAIEVWNEAYQMEEWNALMINPTALFPGVVHSGTATRSAAQLDAHTRESVSTAGLHCLTYHRYNSRWVFRRTEDYLGQMGRCLNIRLREHHRSLKGAPYSHLARHSR